jgi:hypothetical protein
MSSTRRRAACFALLFASVLPAIAVAAEPAAAARPGNEIHSDEALALMCEKTICQHDLHVQLRAADGSRYDKTFAVFPGVVQGDLLVVVAGQTLLVEAELGEEGLTGMRVVEAVTKPESTLEISFEQTDDGGMLLNVQNPFDRNIKWRVGIMPLDGNGDRLMATSSCPMMANAGIFEMWPEPIFQVVLANSRYVDDDATVCD